jgi:hypothetical protein
MTSRRRFSADWIPARRGSRWAAAPDLPDDPSAEQVEAWVDLAELVADRGFRDQVRQVAGIGAQIQSGRWLVDVERAQDEAEAACQRGVPPDSAEAARIVAQILDGTPGAQRPRPVPVAAARP